MAIFSTSSVRDVRVGLLSNSVSTPGNYGTAVKTTDGDLYLTFTNALGQQVKTDNIPISAIKHATTKVYAARTLRKDTITFETPVVGQTYTLRIVFRQWGSGSSENQYFKHVGSVKAVTGETPTTLATKLKAAADINFAREPIQLLTFTVDGATLVIDEVAQPFVRGKQQGRPLNYYIQYVKITDANGNENVTWGSAVTVPGFAGQGTANLAADMEYFYLGERGDKYRNVGYPYTFDTTYLVDMTKQYDVIDIAYTSKNPGAVGVENDMRYLTILCVNTGASALAKEIAGDINTLTGATTVPVIA